MANSYLFTSESVSEGHPDKVADQISDAILDAILKEDKRCRVAVETLVKTGVAIVAGEVTTNAWVDIEGIVRETVLGIGYNSSEMGFDGASCGVLNVIGKQSADIAQGVDRGIKVAMILLQHLDPVADLDFIHAERSSTAAIAPAGLSSCVNRSCGRPARGAVAPG